MVIRGALVFVCAVALSCVPGAMARQNIPQAPATLAAWRIGNAHITARADGWVELAVEFTTREHLASFPFREPRTTILFDPPRFRPHRQIFSPDEVLGSLDDELIARAPNTTPPPSIGTRPEGRLEFEQGAGDPPLVKAFFTSSCSGYQPVHDYLPDGSTRWLVALDSAARLARSYRTVPLAMDSTVPRDESAVSCPATIRVFDARMPTDPQRRAHAVESVARFVVRASGRVDTSTAVFLPALEAPYRAEATKALSQWEFDPAILGGAKVSQWVHAPLIFVNPERSDTLAQGRSFDAPEWAARSDGFLEWTHTGDKRVRALFEASRVRSWLADLQRLIDAAPTDPRQVRNTLSVARGDPDVWYGSAMPQPNALEWNTTLGSIDGTTLTAGLYWTRLDPVSTTLVQVFATTCHGRRIRVESGVPGELEALRSAGIAARVAGESNTPSPHSVDYSAVFGELTVTCPAERVGLPEDVMTEDYHVARRLSLSNDAIAVFVVNATGTVEPRSIAVFESGMRDDARRIAAEIRRLRFLPAQIGTRAVRQRVRYHIRATPVSPMASDPIRKEFCLASGGTSVRIRILHPREGVQLSTLEQTAQQVARTVHEYRADSVNVEGQLNFVVLPAGNLMNVSWATPPAVTELGPIRFGTFWWVHKYLLPVAPAEPVGVEAVIGGSC